MLFLKATKHIFNPSDIKHPRLGTWTLLTTASIIVMVSSIQAYSARNCDSYEGKSAYCARSVFGIALGCISAVLGGLTLLGVLFGPAEALNGIFKVEAFLSLLISTSWAFGVALITGATGPGTSIGNLYYFTWISFFSVLVIFLDCLGHMRPKASGASTGKKKKS